MTRCSSQIAVETASALACNTTQSGCANDASCFSINALILCLLMESPPLSARHPDDSEEGLIRDLRSLGEKLCGVADPFDDGWAALADARQIALRIARFYDSCLIRSLEPNEQFLLVSQLFRRLTNDTWKLLAGDSAIRIGRGIESDNKCETALVVVLTKLGAFLKLALDSQREDAFKEAIGEYRKAMAAHFRMAIACEAFLVGGSTK